LQSGTDQVLDIRPVADFPEIRPHYQNVADVVEGPTSFHSSTIEPKISPTGARAAFGVRGEILTVPAEKGDIRNLTQTTGVVERDPVWSPDGKFIAYFSDESGEYALHVRDQSGRGEIRKIDLGRPPTFYYSPTWSPDSRKIAYIDNRLDYWYVDLEKRAPVRLDTDLYGYNTLRLQRAVGLQIAWSPDGGSIAYVKQLRNHLRAVFVYSVAEGRRYQLTDGMSDARCIAFDKTGQYLYFTASTDIGLKTDWLEMTSLHRPVTRSVYAIMLKKTESTPLIPESDEEGTHKTEQRYEQKTPKEKSISVGIDFEGISQRIVRVPIPARNYYGLFAGKPGSVFLVEGPQVDDPFSIVVGDPVRKVFKFDLITRKTTPIVEDVTYFDLSFNGDKMLYAKNDQAGRKKWFITSVDKSPGGSRETSQSGMLNLESMRVYVEPQVEWKHMYEQVWRDERDFFYDPGLHGLNLEGVKRKYEPFLENISSRSDLDYLFNEMLGNIAVGHVAAAAPHTAKTVSNRTGLLGADYSIENGRYRFARIYSGDNWTPEVRSPLSEPGMTVQAGEYLLAINGRTVSPSADVYSYFEETAGQQIVLRVGPKFDGSGSRDVTVVPVDDESALRYHAWIENNRRRVDQVTGGRVAYVYLPDTNEAGYSNFNRYFFAQVGKDAAIIDERYNTGGLMPDYIIDYLRRPLLNFFNMRAGEDITTPMEAIFGPKVMVINELAGSGGDALPWMFRKAGIGPLIGKRTWGGLVGNYTHPGDLLDGGSVSTPNLAFYNPNGTWDVENYGVPPDVEVEDDPKAVRAGHDPQLEKAVEVVLSLLREHPRPPAPQHPPYPNFQTREPH
jgi:tricorn protease